MTNTVERSSTTRSQSSATMMQLLGGFQLSQAIYVVAKLDVPTILSSGPRTVADLTCQTGAKSDVLRRLIRCLSPVGLFHLGDDDMVELTPLGGTLSAGHPESLRAMAMYWMETSYLPFSELLHTVRTGEASAQRFLGKPFFEWIASDPERAGLQNRAMASNVRGSMFESYTLPPGDLVADIGGADGALLTQLIAGQESRHGIVFDLPEIISSAEVRIAEAGLAGRIETVGGDFFRAVPPADVYVLSEVLHDWDDASCERILRSIRRAAAPGARLVAVELVMPLGDEPHLAKLVDLTMLMVGTGRERTADEHRSLLARSGFTLNRIVPSSSPFSFIEATVMV